MILNQKPPGVKNILLEQEMRERAMFAHRMPDVKFRTRGVFHTVWVYWKKGRLLVAVVATRYPHSKVLHDSQYKMRLLMGDPHRAKAGRGELDNCLGNALYSRQCLSKIQ
jgi:hypothetical protein